MTKWYCETFLYIDFRHADKNTGIRNHHRTSAAALISFSHFLNATSIIFLMAAFTEPGTIKTPISICWYFGIAVSTLSYAQVYFKYLSKNRYLQLAEEFQVKPKLWNPLVIYLVATLLFLILASVLVAARYQPALT